MSRPCPRCGVPAPVVVSSDGALPPELVMADEAARLREALEQVAKACPQCAGTGVYYHDRCETCREIEWDNRCHAPVCCIARAALATATAKGG